MLKELLGNTTFTTNGAVAYKSTNNNLLNLFGKAGALRKASVKEIETLIANAMKDDTTIATKLIFYFGDIREGMGERRFFQIAINFLANNYPEIMERNIELIPYYNRWDSIYNLINTPLEAKVFAMAREQFEEDLKSDTPSLLAKWLKTTNDTSKTSKELAFKTYQYFGYKSTIKYNQAVRSVRKKLNLIETKLTEKNYENIEMKEIPTKAQSKYSKALKRHIPTKFEEYYNKLTTGEIVRETKTLYPHEIIRINDIQQQDALWKSLPNLFEDNNENILPIIDTSGSMASAISFQSSVRCLDVAVGLGIYLAERNNGYFKDFWVNFSTTPNFYNLKGETLSQRIRNLDYHNWQSTTNIEAVYDLLLDTIVRNNIPKEEVPTKLFIVSDMQFNCVRDYNSSIIDDIDRKYQKAGIERPTIVFWQVNANNSNVPITKDHYNTMLVSGFSQNLLPYVLGNEEWTPMTPILKVTNSERYKLVTIE